MPAQRTSTPGGTAGPPPRAHRPGPAISLALAAFVALIAGLSYLMNRFPANVPVVVGLSVLLGFLCFVRMKWVLYVLVFVCLFSPELRVGEELGRLAKRTFTVRVEDLVLAVILVAWLARAAAHKELGLMLRTPLNRPIFLYALVCIVATGTGIAHGWVTEHTAAIFFVLKYIQYFVLFFMIVNHVESTRDVRNILLAGLVTYAVMCAYGLAQIPVGARPSTFGEHPAEPNTLAGYLLLMMGVCAGLLVTLRELRYRLALGVLWLAGLVLIGYTLSRSGWAGLIGMLAVLMTVGRQRYAVAAAVVVVVAAMALVSYQADWLPEPIRERVEETRGAYTGLPGTPPPSTLFGFDLDPSASERYESYRAAIGTWGRRSGRFWLPALIGSGVLGAQTFVDGQYVRVLIETGLLGLAAFVYLLVVIWRHVWSAYNTLETPWHRGLALGYLAGFAALLVHALAANSFIIVRIMEPFFILTGAVVLLPTIGRAETAPKPAAST